MSPVTNILILVTASLAVGAAYRFAAPKIRTRSNAAWIAAFVAFFGLALLFNALLAYQARAGLALLANAPPSRSLQSLNALDTGVGVIVEGRVSAANPLAYQEYVIYSECDSERNCTTDGTLALLIALQDGDLMIENTDYESRNWPGDTSGVFSTYYLQRDTDVIVTGFLARGTPINGERDTAPVPSIHASIVYAGSHADFVARAKRSLIAPTVLTVINLVAAASAFGLVAAIWKSPQAL